MRGNIKVNADYEATMPAKAKRTSDEYDSRDQLNHFVKQKYDKKVATVPLAGHAL